jgi:HD-like signal output (HDOD) protein
MSATAAKAGLLSKIEGLNQIPTIPAVLAPLLRYLQQPVEQLDVQKVSDMIAQDKALAAQCLQLANSPLFGKWQKIDSIRGAIVSLGFQRVSDIVMSCGVLNMTPRDGKDGAGIDPVVFWEHSLGCALVCRHFARKISYADPGKSLPGRPSARSRHHRKSLDAAY